GRKLNRSATHRRALMRNLTCVLIERERIITTVAKAKAMRPFAEKLITLAKKGTLHARRLVLARLGNQRAAMQKLFKEIGPPYPDGPGVYPRLTKRPQNGPGAAGPTAFIELIPEGEPKPERDPPKAPRVAEPKAETAAAT